MSIMKRFVRLMKADLHGILDCLEEPEAILQQAVRDMEETVEQLQNEVTSQRKRREAVERSISQNDTARREAERQIELCFQAGNEQLARTFVRKKLEATQREKMLKRQCEEISHLLDELTRKEREHQEKLSSVREKMDIFCEAAQARGRAPSEPDGIFVTEESVELALLEERAKLSASRTSAAGAA